MTAYESWHWRVYNVMRRMLGIMATFAGLVFLFTPLLLHLGWMIDEPGRSRAGEIIAGLIALALGLNNLRRPTYRPDLGDVSFWTDSTGGPMRVQPERGRRSWWTGNYK